LDCLGEVMDPEVGISVVDLGLIYRAARTAERIDVALTLTTRACPLGDMLVAEARERLALRFQDVESIDVRLVWEPLWTPALMTNRGLALLGLQPRHAGNGSEGAEQAAHG
jgi:metal-sulfur cluster biosynthetic enzyme